VDEMAITLKKMGMKKRIPYLTPKKYREFFKDQMRYAGLREEFVSRFIGFTFFFSIFLAAVIAFDLWILGFGVLGIVTGIGIGVLSIVIIHASVILIADSRAAEMEKVLPDALQLMAANVRAGMTVDKAIWLSARPEFGILEEEIKRVGAKTVGGKTIKEALIEMTTRIKSRILDRTVKLIIEGIESGGELAPLLEETSDNIRTTQAMRKEIKTSVTAYSIFILFAAVLGAPMLFAISLFFVEVMTKLWGPEVLGGIEAVGTGIGGGGFFAKAGGLPITPDELFWFALASMTVTTLFGSLLIGLIQTGREKNGLKFIPLLVLGAIAVFFLARFIIGSLFGELFLM